MGNTSAAVRGEVEGALDSLRGIPQGVALLGYVRSVVWNVGRMAWQVPTIMGIFVSFVHRFLIESSDFYLFVASEERGSWRFRMKQDSWTEQISLEGRDFFFFLNFLFCIGI